jgi:hypothetical protein
MNVQVGKTFAGQRQSSVNYIGEISRLVGVRSSRWAQTCGEPGYSTIRIGLPPTYTDQVHRQDHAALARTGDGVDDCGIRPTSVEHPHRHAPLQ